VEQAFQELDAPAAAETVWRPATEILQDPQAYILRFDLPGVAPEAIRLQVEEGSLWLAGDKPQPVDEGRRLRGERRYGRFGAAVPLPRDVDAEGLTAELDQGVLTVTLPRRAAGGSRTIPVGRKGSAT
jgi:HSP20 family protein